MALPSALLVATAALVGAMDDKAWTSKDYPDIRSKPWGDKCGSHIPPFGYVCDPSHEPIIGPHDAEALNNLLSDLAKTTRCQCQRRSQCLTETGSNNAEIKVGFVVAVAFVGRLALLPIGNDVDVAEKFSKGLRSRWGLGDCGNSAVILIWEEKNMVHISTDEALTKLYVTDEEAVRITAKVKDKMANKEYLAALQEILENMKKEFEGEREKPVDVGTLALAVSASVAILVVGIIVGCVCAFRCCGNMQNGAIKETVDNLTSDVLRRNAPHPLLNDSSPASSCYYDGGQSIV